MAEAVRIQMDELYPAFEANQTDQLLSQLLANGVSTLRVEIQKRKVTVTFTKGTGTRYEVTAKTISQALYDACCINES